MFTVKFCADRLLSFSPKLTSYLLPKIAVYKTHYNHTPPSTSYPPSPPPPLPTHTHTDVIPTADPAVGFKDVDVAILVGAMPRREGMERKDLLKANARIFESQGKALNQHAKKTVKV